MSSHPRNPQYWLERRTKRRSGYPAATLAYYGPDDKHASKAVVGIILSESSPEPSELKKFHSEHRDLRSAPAVTETILEFLDEQRVKRIVTIDRIIGCPHEEGIDYPDGESCPRCPFWADRDRWMNSGVL